MCSAVEAAILIFQKSVLILIKGIEALCIYTKFHNNPCIIEGDLAIFYF